MASRADSAVLKRRVSTYWTVLVGCVVLAAIFASPSSSARTGPPARLFLQTCVAGRTDRQITLTETVRIVAVANAGRCDAAVHVSSRGRRNVLWGTDFTNGLWQSSDDMRTWRLVYRADGYSTIERVLQLSSGYVLLEVEDAAGHRYVLRSLDTSGTMFGAPVFTFPDSRAPPSGPRLLGSQSWAAVGSTVYMGEYCDNEPVVYLWRSTDDGRSFSVVHAWTDIRHIHSVFLDPFVSDRVWVTIGDNGKQSRVSYSDDGGATFTNITQGIWGESRAIGLLFSPDAVYWATDAPELPGTLYRWQRSTGVISPVMTHINAPFYFTAQYGPTWVDLSAVGSVVGDHYIGDKFAHVAATSDGGHTWATAPLPWPIPDPDFAAGSKAGILGITAPDGSGRIWVSYLNLGSDGVANYELALGPLPAAAHSSANSASSRR